MKIRVGISARHVHLTKESLSILFGDEYELHKQRNLNQPMQFAAEETVTLKTPKSEIVGVRVLGPIRSYNQVEISKTDAIKLGICPPIRDSGDILESAPITLIGPQGKVYLPFGCIIASRHIHLTREQAQKYNLVGDEVMVKIANEKGAILQHVHLKIKENAYFEMHLDTDDANAHLLSDGDEVEIIGEEICQNYQK